MWVLLFLLNWFYLVKPESSECLINAENILAGGCKLCSPSYYSLDYLRSNKNELNDCKLKITDRAYTKVAFVISGSEYNFGDNQYERGSDVNPYTSLNEAFLVESFAAAPYQEVNLKIYLMSDVYFKDEENAEYNYFRGINVGLEISPAYCDIFPFINQCVPANTIPIVYLKSLRMRIFISYRLTIRSIQFDGRDIWSNSSCKKLNTICCQSSACSDFSYTTEDTDSSAEFPDGIINLEAQAKASGEISVPTFEMKDAGVRNVVAINTGDYPSIFIKIYNFGLGIVKVQSLFIENSIFSNGIILIDDKYNKDLLKIKNFLFYKNSTSISPDIQIYALIISGYNTLGLKIGSSLGSLFKLQSFAGNFTMKQSQFTSVNLLSLNNTGLSSFIYFHASEEYDLIYNKDFRGRFEINDCKVMGSSSFHFFHGFNLRTGPHIFFSIVMSQNLFSEVFKISGAGAFFITSNYSGYLPQSCFACFEFCSIHLTQSNFFNLTKYPLLIERTPSILKSTSTYDITIIEQFNTIIEKNQSLAKDKIYISSFRLLNSSDSMFSLISNMHSVYSVSIDNSDFSIMALGQAQFIRLSVENLISITNSILNQIAVANHFILIEPGYQLLLENVTIKNMIIVDGAVLQLKSFTKFQDTHTFDLINLTVQNINFAIKNLSLFLVSSEGSKVFLLSSRYETSGYGTKVKINNSSFLNIFVDLPYENMYFFFLACGKFSIEDSKFFNISNSLTVYYLATIIDGSAYFRNCQGYFERVPIKKFFISSMEFFESAFISNVSIVSSLVFESSLFRINNVLKCQISNSSFKGASEGGFLVFIGVHELVNFLCINVIFEGSVNYRRVTGGLGFQTRVGAVGDSFSFLLKLSNASRVGILNCNFLNLDNTAIMILEETQILINNVSFTNILSNRGGGVLVQARSSVLITDIFCLNLKSQANGGFLFAENSVVSIKNSTFSSVASTGSGGAIESVESQISIFKVKFLNLFAKFGGAISAESSVVVVDNCIFSSGLGTKIAGFINTLYGKLTVSNANFSQGRTNAKGACFYLEGTQAWLIDITFKESVSDRVGVVILIGSENELVIFVNIKIFDNVARNCPALFIHNLNVYLYNITFFNNTAEVNIIEIHENLDAICVIFMEVIFKSNFAKENIILTSSHKLIFYEGEFVSNRALCHLKSGSNDLIVFYNFTMISSNEKYINFNELASKKVYFMDIKSKSFIMQEVNIKGDGNLGGIYAESCNLVFLKTVTIHSTIGVSGAAVNLLKSPLIFDNSLIINCIGVEKAVVNSNNGNRLYFINCKFNSNRILSDNEDSTTNICFKSYDTSVTKMRMFLFKTSFFNISKTSVSLSDSELYSHESIFFGNALGNLSQAFRIINGRNLIFLDLIVIKTLYLGSIFIDNTKSKLSKSSLLMSYAVFYLCSNVFLGGGALSIHGSIAVTIKNSFFIDLVSKFDGGGIYYECRFNNQSCMLRFEGSNMFLHNEAYKRGGAIYIANQYDRLVQESNFFEQNRAPIGNNISASPSKIALLLGLSKIEVNSYRETWRTEEFERINNSTKLEELLNRSFIDRVEIFVGKPVDLTILLLDRYGNLVTDIGPIGFQIKLNLDAQATLLSPVLINNYALTEGGLGIFESLSISAKNWTAQITGVISALESIENEPVLHREIYFSLVPCERGDIFDDDSCAKCQIGTYSFENNPIEKKNSSCSPCPANAICPGGYLIQPNEGYWRSGNESDIIVKCSNENACPSRNQTEREIFGDCGDGYEGAFCGYCKPGYAMITDQCEKCNELRFYVGLIIPYTLFFSFIFLAQKEVQSKNQASELRTLTNALTNHFSNLMIVSSFDLDWRIDLKDIFSIFKFYVSPSSENIFSFGCMLPFNGDALQMASLLIITVSPMYFVFLFLFLRESMIILSKSTRRMIHKRILKNEISTFRSKKVFRQQVKLAFLLIFFNLYSTLILSFIKALDCIEIETNKGVMKISPDIDCSSNDYLFYEIISGIALLIWGLGIPFTLFIISRSFRGQMKKSSKIKTSFNFKKSTNFTQQEEVGDKEHVIEFRKKSKQRTLYFMNFTSELGRYLTLGYTEKYYYWESVIYLRKLFIILISLLTNYIDVKLISEINIVFFVGFFFFNMKARIYASTKVQDIETYSLLGAILSLCLGLLARKENGFQIRSIIYLLSAVLINILFIIEWTRVYVSIQFTQIKEIFSPKKNKKFRNKRIGLD